MRVVPTHTCFPHEAAKNISYADVTVKKCASFQHTPVSVIELQKVFHPVPGLVVKKRESFQHTCFPHEAAKSISSCARTGGQKA